MVGPSERHQIANRFAQDLTEVLATSLGCDNYGYLESQYTRGALAKKLESQEPLISNIKADFDDKIIHQLFERLLNCFQLYFSEKSESLENLIAAYQRESLSVERLLKITLDNSWSDLKNIAYTFSIDLDLLQLFTIYLARPFRQQAAEQLTSGLDLGPWKQGYCPVCDHRPVLGSILGKEGQRWLWCCCCNTQWRFPRIQCPFCLNQSQEELGYLTLEDYSDHRIYICDKCRRYLKEIISESERNEVNFEYDREYLTSASLDQAALAQGYISEPIWISRNDLPGDLDPEICSESK